MKTAIQKMIEYLQKECQPTITNQWHIKKAKELIELERQQNVDAFIVGKAEGYKGAKGQPTLTSIEYYNLLYNNRNNEIT